MRIGFEQVTPVQIRTDSGFAGLAVDIINEAARRTGLSLQWVETGTSSDDAFRRGLVDLWPLMADLPHRRKVVHITTPWLLATHALVLHEGLASLGRRFDGRIAVFRLPVQVRLARQEFPNAQLIEFPEPRDVLKEVCEGKVSAGFMEGRVAVAVLRERPPECASMGLRVQPLPDLTVQLGIASTFQAAGAADKLREEINNLVLDGTVSAAIVKYSFYSLDDMRNTYTLIQAAERARWMAWGISIFGIGLIVTISQATFLRYRKRSEVALRASEERFRRVFEEGPLGLALVGEDYCFLKVNDALCQMVGYSEASLLEMSFVDITHSDDLRTDVELAERLFKNEIPFYKLRKRYVKKSGEIIWIDLTASLIRNSEGEPVCGLAMIEDITEIKRAKEIEDRLTSELAVSRDEIRALAARLLTVQEDERRSLSRELHDQVCQNLVGLAIKVAALANRPPPPKEAQTRLKAIQASMLKAAEEARDLAYQMHSPIFDDLGLAIALEDLCRKFSEQHPDIPVDLETPGLPASVPREVATCILRVAQESLQNIAKHSSAKHVSVALGFENGAVALMIADDGIGFDLRAVKGRKGLGLIGMEERTRLVKGKLTITAQPAHGTQITLEIPLQIGNS